MLDRKFMAAATTRHRPHVLLVGPRGSGKTHLVEVALHGAMSHPEVRDHLVIVRLDEDVVGIHRYRDVLRAVLIRLTGGEPAGSRDEPEAAIAAALGDRVLVLVIENLDRLFKALRSNGQQELRAWVENSRQVMLLATTPLLFPGVQDRERPWFGNFAVSHLSELTAAEGTTLLRSLALGRRDAELAGFLSTPRGAARVQAINHLAGGSPRIWMILSECIDVQLLDELTPAVEALLEGLVPYYQQLLWDLSDVEQALVMALAEGSAQAMTVSEVAAVTDVDERTAGTSFIRLARARWVRAEKSPGTDQRTTWYRIREPLLRHHLQYRSAVEQPLPLIVELLRAWFDPQQRRVQLREMDAGSMGETFLAHSLSREPHLFDQSYSERNLDELLVEARRWISGGDAASRTADAGAYIEFAVLAVRNGPDHAAKVLAQRRVNGASPLSNEQLRRRAEEDDAVGAEVDRAGALLRHLSSIANGRTALVLGLVSACWDGHLDPATAEDRLAALRNALADAPDDPLRLDITDELAFWTGSAGDHAAARLLYADLITDRARVLGPDHPDTLKTRHGHAYQVGEAGDAATARDLYADLITDLVRVLGPDHPDTLNTRHNYAYQVGEAGDAATARNLCADLITDLVRVLGPDHPNTLNTRHNYAYQVGEAGDAATARNLCADLITDRVRFLGPDHPDTLTTRYNYAQQVGEAGDAATARDLYADLITDCIRVLGPDHPDTLTTRHNHAYQVGAAGDAATARDLNADLITDRVRVLGPDHPDTLNTRHGHAYQVGAAGDAATARDLNADLITDLIRVLGPDHPDTLTTRHNHAYQVGAAGDATTARDLNADLITDHVRVLGPDHPKTLTTRHNHAHQVAAAGDATTALDLLLELTAELARVRGSGSMHRQERLDAIALIATEGRRANAVQQLMQLAAEPTGHADPETHDWLNGQVGEAILFFVRVPPSSEDSLDAELPGAALLGDLRAAAFGDAFARARVPGELLALIDEAR